MKRVLSLVLVLLLVSALAVPAFAADPLTITPPKCSPATVGHLLSSVTLSGGSAVDSAGNPVAGTFVWLYPKTQLTASGTFYSYECVFYPTDPAYKPQVCYPAVAVYRISLTVATRPTVEGTLKVGEKVSELKLSDGLVWNHFFRSDRPTGHFEFVEPDTTFDKTGEYSVAVVFVPDNEVMYNRATVTYERNPDKSFKNAFVTVTVGDKSSDAADSAQSTNYATAGKWRAP